MNIRAIAVAAFLAPHPMIAAAGEVSPLNGLSGTTTNNLLLSGVAVVGGPAGRQCPNEGRMSRLCQYIGSKTKDADPKSDYTYGYQRVVYEAACVDIVNDSDELIVEKVRTMWALHGQHLRCGPMGVPATGSPIRFAIHTAFHDFISDALHTWRLDLNGIENGQTTLDFLDERISKASGESKAALERYRQSFVRTGARKADEL